MEVINKRRSVRRFKDQEVESSTVEQLLKAGMQAPSAGNQRPWEFVVVRDSKLKDAIGNMSPYSGMAATAPVLIIVCGSKERMRMPEFMAQDLGACTQNILLEAVNQELGTVWIGVYPKEERVQLISEILNLPESLVPYNVIVVGHPELEDANHFVDRYEADRVHFDKC